MKVLSIEIRKSEANGGEWHLEIDGELKGIYGSKQKLQSALSKVMDTDEVFESEGE